MLLLWRKERRPWTVCKAQAPPAAAAAVARLKITLSSSSSSSAAAGVDNSIMEPLLACEQGAAAPASGAAAWLGPATPDAAAATAVA
jgi:hypothetical protein